MRVRCLFGHKFETAGVRTHEIVRTGWKEGDPPMARKTTVLMVCARCPQAKTYTLDGHWTVEQVQGRRHIDRPETQPWKGYR